MPNNQKSNPIAAKILKETYGADLKDGKAKIMYRARGEGVVDIVKNGEEVVFLMADGSISDSIIEDGVTYSPPKLDSLAFDLPDYPSIKKILEASDEGVSDVSGGTDVLKVGGETSEKRQLFDDILEYHKASSQMPDDYLYLIVTAWDFHTHMIDKLDFSPIIAFTGLPEKGKSRMARSMMYVSRRGIIKASISDAQLIREAQDHEASIFFDMKDFTQSVKDAGSEDVVLSRFERGLKVGRVLYPDRGAFQDLVYYSVFGPTLVGSNESLDTILETRGITIVMRQATKDFPSAVSKKEGNKLRDRLIAWKVQNWGYELPEVPKLVSGRFGDVMRPLHQMVLLAAPEREQEFINAIKTIDKNRHQERQDTMEADILKAILKSDGMVAGGVLAVKIITDKMNEVRSDKEKLTYQRVGRKLNIMGYKKARMSDGASAIIWSEKSNLSLQMEYGLTDVSTETSPNIETSDISYKSVTSLEHTATKIDQTDTNNTISSDVENWEKIFQDPNA